MVINVYAIDTFVGNVCSFLCDVSAVFSYLAIESAQIEIKIDIC